MSLAPHSDPAQASAADQLEVSPSQHEAVQPEVVLPGVAPEPQHPLDPTIEVAPAAAGVPAETLAVPEEEAPAPRRRGRRPAGQNTRATILDSARTLFLEGGYDAVSMRAIARHAQVDPALLHHYFKGKPQLFLSSVAGVAADPGSNVAAMEQLPRRQAARTLVFGFLEAWDLPEAENGFPSMLGLASASPRSARAFEEFLRREVICRFPVLETDEHLATLRAEMVASCLLGAALSRYVLRLPRFSQGSAAELADWLSPTVEHYLWGHLRP